MISKRLERLENEHLEVREVRNWKRRSWELICKRLERLENEHLEVREVRNWKGEAGN